MDGDDADEPPASQTGAGGQSEAAGALLPRTVSRGDTPGTRSTPDSDRRDGRCRRFWTRGKLCSLWAIFWADEEQLRREHGELASVRDIMVDGPPELVRRLLVQMAANDDLDDGSGGLSASYDEYMRATPSDHEYRPVQEEEEDEHGEFLSFTNAWLAEYFSNKVRLIQKTAPEILHTADLDAIHNDDREAALLKAKIENFGRCSAKSLVYLRVEMARIETTLAKQEAMTLKLLGSLWTGAVLLAQWYHAQDAEQGSSSQGSF